MSKKPSPTQQDTLNEMAKFHAEGRIHRLNGGFWTTLGMTFNGRGVPDWSVTIPTIRAMEQRGWLQRRNVHAEEWRDERELTNEGRALAVRKDPQDTSSGKEQAP